MPSPSATLSIPLGATVEPHAGDSAGRGDRTQDELECLQQELEHAHRLATLGTLTAGIAHEINNILTPVLAYAQLASSHPSDTALQSKAIAKALAGAQIATQITQAMLGFASNPDEPARANIEQVLHASIETLGRNPDKDRISLRFDVPGDLQVAMRPLALQQVLMNLLINAWNAIKTERKPRGGAIGVSAITRSDGMVLIRVMDDGPGIPPDIAARLFKPFASSRKRSRYGELAGDSPNSNSVHQKNDSSANVDPGGPTETTAGAGTGLGLTICRRLVENAGGTIAAGPNPGRGTVFSITLPACPQQRARAG